MEENKRASSGDSASRNVVGGGEAEQKPCRACYDFRTWMTRKFKADDAPTSSKTSAAGLVNASSSAPTANADEEEVRACGFMRPPKNPAAQKPLPPDCPVDKARLGRGSWDLLHTMAAHYDTAPDAQRQTQMTQFLQLFSQFYPCDWCATDLRKYMSTHPVNASSQTALTRWMCDMHNDVNARMNKPLFDCSTYNSRWRDGWPDGRCD